VEKLMTEQERLGSGGDAPPVFISVPRFGLPSGPHEGRKGAWRRSRDLFRRNPE
jgi:hypothetical protein